MPVTVQELGFWWVSDRLIWLNYTRILSIVDCGQAIIDSDTFPHW
ncbi:MAG: hypothetical protein AAFQ89_24960 [Cyanobacteria bacterium J06626_18]